MLDLYAYDDGFLNILSIFNFKETEWPTAFCRIKNFRCRDASSYPLEKKGSVRNDCKILVVLERKLKTGPRNLLS